MKRSLLAGAAIAAAMFASSASATTFVVQAQANSSSGGSALNTGINLNAGDFFTVSSSLNDLWSAGALPRYSDANGLVGPRLATPADDSGQPTGTLIGANFGLWTQDGLSAPYGSLVGEIGGAYQLLGANFAGTAWNSGPLNLLYWDSNNYDNFGAITFNVSPRQGAVPEPSTWAMMLAGFGLVGFGLRRRKQRRGQSAIGYAF